MSKEPAQTSEIEWYLEHGAVVAQGVDGYFYVVYPHNADGRSIRAMRRRGTLVEIEIAKEFTRWYGHSKNGEANEKAE